MAQSRQDKYKALRLRQTEGQDYVRIDERRLRAPDGSIVLARQTEDGQDAADTLVLDIGTSSEAQPEQSAPRVTKRKKAAKAAPPEVPTKNVGFAKGGMVINAPFLMALNTPEFIVLKGKRPLAMEPQILDTEPEGTSYDVILDGKTYSCIYVGITYSETPDTQTVILHKT